MRAFITGVGGFSGVHLVRRLRQEPGIEIAGLGLKPSRPDACGLDHYFQADITNADAVATAVREFNPDLLFHLAGAAGNSTPVSRLYEVNVLGTVHVLEALRAVSRDCAALLVGSASEYGSVKASGLPITEDMPCRPIGPYGISKYVATLIAMDYARRYDMRVSVVRPFNIIGPGVSENLVVGALIARVKQAVESANPVIKIGDANSKRDFVDVFDVVDAYVRLAKSGVRGEIFNICSGRAYSIRHVAKTLLANSSRPIVLEVDPSLVSISPARIIYGSYRKAARAIGFRPSTSLKAALSEAWDSAIGSLERKDRTVNRAKNLVTRLDLSSADRTGV